MNRSRFVFIFLIATLLCPTAGLIAQTRPFFGLNGVPGPDDLADKVSYIVSEGAEVSSLGEAEDASFVLEFMDPVTLDRKQNPRWGEKFPDPKSFTTGKSRSKLGCGARLYIREESGSDAIDGVNSRRASMIKTCK